MINTPAHIDVISPAEAKTWAEWAKKAPALLRPEIEKIGMESSNASVTEGKSIRVAGLTLGVVLGGATATKYIPGKWKWVSGAAAVGSAAFGMYAGARSDAVSDVAAKVIPQIKGTYREYVSRLAADKEVQAGLADYLSKSVTAEDLQAASVDQVIKTKAIEYGNRYIQEQHLLPRGVEFGR